MKEAYLKNDFASIVYDTDHHVLILRWLHSPTLNDFREGMNALLPAFGKFKTGKLVTDLQDAGALHHDSQEWIVNEWRPKAVNAGHSHLAIILSATSDIFAWVSAETAMEKVTFPTAYFDNLETALKWLKNF